MTAVFRISGALVASALALSLVPVAAVVAPASGGLPGSPDDSLVVDAGGARVVMSRDPFRLTITDGSGRTVLREVAASGDGHDRGAAHHRPASPGGDNQDTTTLYAPLSFMVGSETLSQFPSTEWVANLKSGTRSGTWYAAQAVQEVERDGSDLVLTLSTNDPTGRQLRVRVGGQGRGAVRVRVNAVPSDGVAMIGDSFQTPTGSGKRDGFFGFGGRHDRLDQRGRVLSSFVNQQNFAASPTGTDMTPNGPAAAFYPQAMFYTTRYGFVLPQPELARFKLAADRPDAWNVTASAAHLDYIVTPGGPARSVRTMTALTGRHRMPPRWALGPMFDRLVKNYGETVPHYEAMLRDDLRQIDKHRPAPDRLPDRGIGFPRHPRNHGMSLHTWVRPAPQARMIRKLRARGIHPLSYLRPWLAPDSAPVAAGYAVKNAAGDPYYVVGTAERRFALLDFTNPEAVAFWKARVRETLDLGFDGFMQDYGEQVLFDMHFADGTTGVTRHNDYMTLMAKATRQELNRYHRTHPDASALVLHARRLLRTAGHGGVRERELPR